MLSQTSVFTQRVRDHMAIAPLLVTPNTPVDKVVKGLRNSAGSAAIIVDENHSPIGILTERDICHRVAFLAPAHVPVAELMSTPVHTIDAADFLHNAVAWMRQDHIRHLPILDNNRVVGLLELEQVLAQVTGQTVAHIDLLNYAHNLPAMQTAKRNQYQIAAQLLAEHVPAATIQHLLTRLNQQLYQAAAMLCLEQMKAEDLGEPPVPFELIVMGSGGRGESYLLPDQDNGLILADYPDGEHTSIDAWFINFSVRLTDALAEIGFAYCHGHVMATNPLWRKTLPQWQAQLNAWIRRGEGQVLRLCDIFFDFISVSYDGDMGRVLRQHIVANAPRLFFLREMFKVDEDHDVALGPFGILLPDRRKGPHKGQLNLKLTGTLPLVGAIRILALRERITALSTLDRITALHEQQVLSRNEHDDLQAAYQHLAFLLLRQQLRDVQQQQEPGNHVALSALSKRERKLLVDGFKAIRALRSKLRSDLTGEVF